MMMNIVGIGTVKNEEDIIESFIRYNMKVLDHLYLIDNGSSDGTVDIIRELIKEGFSVTLTQKPGEFNQIHIMNDLLSHATQGNCGVRPTFVIPLDADEFIVPKNQHTNPRDIISNFSHEQIYMLKWMNYIPESDVATHSFIPYSMSLSRSDDYEEVEKLIIPCDIVHKGFILNNGNHDVYAPYNIKKCKIDELRIAHYPIRDKYQFILKNVLGYYNRLATKTYVKGRSRHIENAYYSIKNSTENLSELMIDYARNYCMSDVPKHAVQYNDSPFQWCEEIQLRYNHLRKNQFFQLLLSNIETIVEKYRTLLLDSTQENFGHRIKQMSETEQAIEQYSFEKMRLERVKRDYYQCKSELLQVWIELEEKGVDCDALISQLIKNNTLIFGAFPLRKQYASMPDVYMIQTDCAQYSINSSISRLLSDIPWSNVHQVIVCDTTRIEEFLSIAKSYGIDKIIILKDYLEKYR